MGLRAAGMVLLSRRCASCDIGIGGADHIDALTETVVVSALLTLSRKPRVERLCLLFPISQHSDTNL